MAVDRISASGPFREGLGFPYDWYMYKRGAFFCCDDREGHAIIAPNTNCNTVMARLLVVAAEQGGGKCICSGQTFDISSISSNAISDFTLEGVYGRTTFKNSANATIALRFGQQSTTSRGCSNITIRNVVFDGNNFGTNTCGLECNGLDGGLFENIIFKDHGTRGLRFTVWATDQVSCRNLTVKNISFSNDAMVIGGVENSVFENLYFTGTLDASLNSVIDCSFGEQNTAGMVQHCTFRDINIDGVTGTPSPFYAIAGFQYSNDITFDKLRIKAGATKVRGVVLIADTSVKNLVFKNFDIRDGHSGLTVTHAIMRDGYIDNVVNYGISGQDIIIDGVKISNTNSGSSATTFDKGCLYFDTMTSPIIVRDCTFSDTGNTTPQGVYFADTATLDLQGCRFTGPFTVSTTATGGTVTGCVVKNNWGHVTEAAGTGTINSGSTNATVTHGLSYTPGARDICITLREDPTNTPGAIWVDNEGATTFKVNCENDPGASNLDFAWSVRRVFVA